MPGLPSHVCPWTCVCVGPVMPRGKPAKHLAALLQERKKLEDALLELEAANRAMAAQLPAGSSPRPQSPHLRSVLSNIEDINQVRHWGTHHQVCSTNPYHWPLQSFKQEVCTSASYRSQIPATVSVTAQALLVSPPQKGSPE